MKATADANILFACLVKNGETRRVWFNPEINLYAPAFIIEEFLKYSTAMQKKSRMKSQEFESLLKKVLSQLAIVPDSCLKPFLPAAATLSSDPKDWLYLACALKENTILWSNDKEFKKQLRVKVRTTAELMHEVGSL